MDYIVYVDSNNRNQTLYPNSNNFTLYLTQPIINISNVEVLSAMLPSMNTSQFITLDILEFRTPRTIVADQIINTNNVSVPSSNAFYGSFGIIPIRVNGGTEFYNQNYRVKQDYPSRIDKIDRLTVSWRQPNSSKLYYDSSGYDLGRTMFLLRIQTEFVPVEPERPLELPAPVPWAGDYDEKKKIMIVGLIGLIIIISFKNSNH
jgi:hypothetical protein